MACSRIPKCRLRRRLRGPGVGGDLLRAEGRVVLMTVLLNREVGGTAPQLRHHLAETRSAASGLTGGQAGLVGLPHRHGLGQPSGSSRRRGGRRVLVGRVGLGPGVELLLPGGVLLGATSGAGGVGEDVVVDVEVDLRSKPSTSLVARTSSAWAAPWRRRCSGRWGRVGDDGAQADEGRALVSAWRRRRRPRWQRRPRHPRSRWSASRRPVRATTSSVKAIWVSSSMEMRLSSQKR